MVKGLITAVLFFACAARADRALMLSAVYIPLHQGGHGLVSDPLDPYRINFETLHSLYKTGRMISFDETLGVYSGTCFTAYEQNKPMPGLLALRTKNQVKKVIAATNHIGAPNYFDSYTESYINNTVDSIWPDTNPVSSEAPLVGTYGPGHSLTEWHVTKAAQGYVLEAMYAGESGDRYLYGWQSVYARKGDLFATCFYTKKIN